MTDIRHGNSENRQDWKIEALKYKLYLVGFFSSNFTSYNNGIEWIKLACNIYYWIKATLNLPARMLIVSVRSRWLLSFAPEARSVADKATYTKAIIKAECPSPKYWHSNTESYDNNVHFQNCDWIFFFFNYKNIFWKLFECKMKIFHQMTRSNCLVLQTTTEINSTRETIQFSQMPF